MLLDLILFSSFSHRVILRTDMIKSSSMKLFSHNVMKFVL